MFSATNSRVNWKIYPPRRGVGWVRASRITGERGKRQRISSVGMRKLFEGIKVLRKTDPRRTLISFSDRGGGNENDRKCF